MKFLTLMARAIVLKRKLFENKLALNDSIMIIVTEAVVRRCSVKKVLLEISQNSQENTCARAFLNKVAGLGQVLSYEFCEISNLFP